MISHEELSSLLAALYAAPLEPEKWQEFMDRLCALIDISCGYLIGHGGGSGVLLAGGGTNFSPEMFQLYDEYYSAQDPYAKPLLLNPRVGLVAGDELYERERLVKSEVYNDFLRKYELESNSVLVCRCDHEQLEGLSLWRGPSHGPLEAESQHLLGILLPHLQTALQLRTEMVGHNAMHILCETALDAISVGTFLVAHGGRVRHMNGRASAYLKEGGGLAVSHGKLVTTNLQETAQLQQLIDAATSGGWAGMPAPGGAIRLVRPGTDTHLQVTVFPVPESRRIPGRDRHALVFISDPRSAAGSRAALMRQIYGLTPTECRLADLLLEGFEVKQAAEQLRITLETARFYLKRILKKTGARRQAELIRLMLFLPSFP